MPAANPSAPPTRWRAGILDKLIEGDLLPGAVAFAREVAAKGGPPRKTRDLTAKLGDAAANAPILAVVREQVKKKARGLIAPFKAVDAVEAAVALPFDEGIKREAELFRECLFSDQSKALIHVFFAEREVAKVPGIAKDTPRIPIRRAAVVGAGTMGGGIAMTYANAGIPVLLKEVDQAALDRGLATIKKNYASTVQKGRLTQQQMDERLARIEPTLSYDRFAEADIVVEAVFEGMALKKQVFAELDKVDPAGRHPGVQHLDAEHRRDRVGHRPAAAGDRPPLLQPGQRDEAAGDRPRQADPAPTVIATSMELAKRLGKVGVLVGNCRAFVGNRMFDPYVREAQFLVEEGAKIEEVDARPDGLRHGDGAAGGPRPGRAGRGLAHPEGRRRSRSRRGGRRSWPRTGSASWGTSARRPGPAGTGTRAAAGRATPNPEAARLAEEAARQSGITPAGDRAGGDRRADRVRPRQRGGANPGGGHRPAGRRHRHRLRVRLRLPARTAAGRCGTPTRSGLKTVYDRVREFERAAREARGRRPRC